MITRCVVNKPLKASGKVNPYSYDNKPVTRTPRADIVCPTPSVCLGDTIEPDTWTYVAHKGVQVVHKGVDVTFRPKK